MQERQQTGGGRENSRRDLRQDLKAGRRTVHSMSVQFAIGQSWMIRHWNFGIVLSAMGIMNIVKIIYSPIST